MQSVHKLRNVWSSCDFVFVGGEKLREVVRNCEKREAFLSALGWIGWMTRAALIGPGKNAHRGVCNTRGVCRRLR